MGCGWVCWALRQTACRKWGVVVYIVLHIIEKGSRLINFFRGEMAAVARFALRVWDLGAGACKGRRKSGGDGGVTRSI